MQDQEALEEEEATLFTQFSIVVAKLQIFAKKVAHDSGFTPEHTQLLVTGMQRSTIMYIQTFQAWFKKHPEAIAKRDIPYFKALLPVQFQCYQLSEENRLKGVQFIEAIELLLEDFNKE